MSPARCLQDDKLLHRPSKMHGTIIRCFHSILSITVVDFCGLFHGFVFARMSILPFGWIAIYVINFQDVLNFVGQNSYVPFCLLVYRSSSPHTVFCHFLQINFASQSSCLFAGLLTFIVGSQQASFQWCRYQMSLVALFFLIHVELINISRVSSTEWLVTLGHALNMRSAHT